MIAVAFSVLAHASLLAVRFAAPDAFRLQPADPGLEVILVNAKHERAPVKAEALAQANLDGGGNADAGRAQSPLPDLRKIENGDSIKALQRRIAELEQQQKNVLTQVRPSGFTAAPVAEQHKPDPTRNGADMLDTRAAIARMRPRSPSASRTRTSARRRPSSAPARAKSATPCTTRRCRSGSRKSAR
jgi:protein TonB